jgi:hypothetical protein
MRSNQNPTPSQDVPHPLPSCSFSSSPSSHTFLVPGHYHYQDCRRFETGGSLGRRVNVVACPSPDGSSARASAKGGRARRPETGVREVGILWPSCSSRAQVGCACSRGLQASSGRGSERPQASVCSRPRPRTANPL